MLSLVWKVYSTAVNNNKNDDDGGGHYDDTSIK